MSTDTLQTPTPKVKLTKAQADLLCLAKKAWNNTIPRGALAYLHGGVVCALVDKGCIAPNTLGSYYITALGEEASR